MTTDHILEDEAVLKLTAPEERIDDDSWSDPLDSLDEPEGSEDEPKGTLGKAGKAKRVQREAAKMRQALMESPYHTLFECHLRALLTPAQKSLRTPEEVLTAISEGFTRLARMHKVKMSRRARSAIHCMLSSIHDYYILHDDRVDHKALFKELVDELLTMVPVMNLMGLSTDEQWGILSDIMNHWRTPWGVIKSSNEMWAIVRKAAHSTKGEDYDKA